MLHRYLFPGQRFEGEAKGGVRFIQAKISPWDDGPILSGLELKNDRLGLAPLIVS